MLFENDSLISGEIQAISSKNGRTAYSNKMGQLLVSGFETKSPENLPELVTRMTIDLQAGSLVRSLAFDESGQKIACGTLDGNVTIIELSDANQISQKIIYNHNGNSVLCLTFVPGRNWLISSSRDKSIRVWDIQNQVSIKDLPLTEEVRKFALAGSDILVFGNTSGQVLKWNLNDLNKEPEIIYKDDSRRPFQSVAYNADHNWLALSSLGNIIIFPFNPGNKENLKSGMVISRHKGAISQLDFSHNNDWLVSASQDAVILWDLRGIGSTEIEKFVPIIVDNSRQIFSLGFDTDNKYLLYGDNRLMHIYPVDINDVYAKLRLKMGDRQLSDQEWKYYVKGDLVKPNSK